MTIQNRYDIVLLFDITDGNPNGDPDAGNMPRTDPETGHGIVSDVCLKRKIRNFIGLMHGEKPPYEIYVKERAVLNLQHKRAYEVCDLKPVEKKLPKEEEDARRVMDWMCSNFWDVRSFGAVMSTKVNCGHVRGPIQICWSRSIDPVFVQEHSITRCAVTTEKEAEDQSGDNRTMGRKFTVPYGLYRVHMYINPNLADKTGFSETDLELFKKALNEMFENDRSAARGEMRPVACIAFRHDSKLGNARADELFKRVEVQLKPELRDQCRPARSFADYDLKVISDLPEGVTIERWI